MEARVNYHISIVVPVYRAEHILTYLYEEIRKNTEKITDRFELIFVDDYSNDCSWQVIHRLTRVDDRVKGIRFSRNFGQHYAITAGLDYCSGDWVIVMDCDFQDPPTLIPLLYDKAQEGYDIVTVKLINRKNHWLRNLMTHIFYRLFNLLTDLNYEGSTRNYRIMSKKVVQSFCQIREQVRFFSSLVHWMGFSTASIYIEHQPRLEGKSSYTFLKLWRLAIETIIANSGKPLTFSVYLGICISLISLTVALTYLLRYIFWGSPVAGWTSLIVSIYFLGGIIILNLGIIGTYIEKIFNETKRRPLYIIKEMTNNISE